MSAAVRTAVLVDVDGVILQHPGSGTVPAWPDDMQREATVEVQDGPLLIRGRALWSTGVIDGLRRIEATPGVTMLWCTTWKERAREVLAPLIGIGADWPALDEIQRNPSGRWFNWWKATRAWEALGDFDRVVWMDDDIAAWSNVLTMQGRDGEWQWACEDRLWWVCPDTGIGLTPDDLLETQRFIAGRDPFGDGDD